MTTEHQNEERSWTIVLVLGLLLLSRFVFSSPETMDYWFFLAKGERVWELGWQALGGPNPFVFTAPPGSVFYDKEWLFEAGLAWLYQHTGHVGPACLRALLAGALLWLFLRISRQLGASPWFTLTWFVLGCTTVVLTRLSVRPHMFGYLFLMLLLLALTSPPKRWVMCTIPLMFALWANIHGSFLMGGLLLTVYVLWAWGVSFIPWLRERAPEQAQRGEAARPWLWVLLSLPVAVMLNPYGWKLWYVLYAFQKEVSSQPDPFVRPEWVGFSPSHPYGLALLVLLALMLLSWLPRQNRAHTERLAWTGVVCLLGLSNLRFVGLAFLLLGPFVAAQLSQWHKRTPRAFVGGFVVLVLLTSASAIQAFRKAPGWGIEPPSQSQPKAAMDFLHKHIPKHKARIYTNLHPTAYIAFSSKATYRTTFDGHVVVPGFFGWSERYKRSLFSPPVWDRHCQMHRCDFVLLHMKDQKTLLVAAHLQQHPQWRPVFFSLHWVLYAHKTRAPSVIQRFAYEHLRSFYSFDRLLFHPKLPYKAITQELQRLRKAPMGSALAHTITGYLTLRKLGAAPLRRPPPLSPARRDKLKALLKGFQQARKAAPWHPGVNLGLGLTTLALQMPQAATYLQQAQSWNPLWLTPQIALARHWHQQKQSQRAKQALHKLQQMGPRGAQAAQTLRLSQ